MPRPASSSRSSMISWTVLAPIAAGQCRGRRDRGSNAAWPSTLHWAPRRLAQPCETRSAGYLAALRPAPR